MDFDFIEDSSYKHILNRDYKELEICLNSKAHKAVMVLCGSILELLLIETLIYFDDHNSKKNDYTNLHLNDLLSKSKEKGLISENSFYLSYVVKDFRNLIHPGREIRKGEIPDEDTSQICVSLLRKISNELRLKFKANTQGDAEKILFKIQFEFISIDTFLNLISRLNKTEKKKLFYGLIELSYSDKTLSIVELKKFHKVLCNFIDVQIRLDLGNELIKKVVNLSFESSVNIFIFSLDDIDLLKTEDQELVLCYFLDKFISSINSNFNYDFYVNNMVFTIFSNFLHVEKVKNQFTELLVKVFFNYSENIYYFFDIYGQCILNLDLSVFEEINSEIRKRVPLSRYNKFISDYDSFFLLS